MACTKKTDVEKEGKLNLVYTHHAPFCSKTARQSTMDWNRMWGVPVVPVVFTKALEMSRVLHHSADFS